MPKRFDPQHDLTPIRGQTIRDLQRAGESGLDFRAAAPMSSQNFGGGRLFRQGPGAAAVRYIQLTGPAGPDGGYPWQAVTQAPPVVATAPGSGYTSAPTATVSGNGWTGWTLTVTISAAAGTVTGGTWTGAAGATGTANEPPTIALSGGGGSGATLAVSDAQDVNAPDQWVALAVAGSYSNAAYEARGCYSLPAGDRTVYPAAAGPNGRLLFFCDPVQVGTTTTDGAYPASVSVYYAVRVKRLAGTQTEGSSGVLADTGYNLHALNVGGSVPPSGTDVVVCWTGTRWVFRYDS